MEFKPSQLLVTDTDHLRLSSLLARSDSNEAALLEEELERAHIVPTPEIPADVVTMNSKVEFRDLETGSLSEVTLVYPEEADADQHRVSVLAPVGSALIGLREGQSISWTLHDGRQRRIRVERVLAQPEALGEGKGH